jgi:hypothetical protein
MPTFIDYYKIVLDRVSFNPELFAKEYKKAKRDLHTSEIGDLNSWIRSKGLQEMVSEPTRQSGQNKC